MHTWICGAKAKVVAGPCFTWTKHQPPMEIRLVSKRPIRFNWAVSGPSLAILGRLDATFGHLGVKMQPRSNHLEFSNYFQLLSKPPWAILGVILGHLEAILGYVVAILGYL